MVDKKRVLGQFFTNKYLWLQPQVSNFLNKHKDKIAYDPFAGQGDLLNAARSVGYKRTKGLDIDTSLGWRYNDSLLGIPRLKNSIIVTNPPYLTNYSAKRKGLYPEVSAYFANSKFDDLYQIAIEKCMTSDYGVMIIPETFINSSFDKSRLVSITVLEENPFTDTENPVCVICFDNKPKGLNDIKVYKNAQMIDSLGCLENKRILPKNRIRMKFNDPFGALALRAIDSTDPKNQIAFMHRHQLSYDLKSIKHSSRLITLISLQIKKNNLDSLIALSNQILSSHRKQTSDILLSPFKGNTRDGIRRRRLDYLTARGIIESAAEKLSK